MHDLVIRNGTVVDGTGRPRFTGDVAIDAGVVAAVGEVTQRGRREIDAQELLVTPGWVDVHTHVSGEVTFENGEPTGARPRGLVRGRAETATSSDATIATTDEHSAG